MYSRHGNDGDDDDAGDDDGKDNQNDIGMTTTTTKKHNIDVKIMQNDLRTFRNDPKSNQKRSQNDPITTPVKY